MPSTVAAWIGGQVMTKAADELEQLRHRERALIDQLAARDAELAAALELQTATSEVLRLISAHSGDLDTVLDGILAKAASLCDADAGVVEHKLSEAQKALSLNPNLMDARRALAGVFFQEGRFREALEEQMRTIEIGGAQDRTCAAER